MSVRVKIDGVGVVEFDDKFKDLSRSEQQKLVNQIAQSRGGAAAPESRPPPRRRPPPERGGRTGSAPRSARWAPP